jgi:hypothetical protein
MSIKSRQINSKISTMNLHSTLISFLWKRRGIRVPKVGGAKIQCTPSSPGKLPEFFSPSEGKRGFV